MEHLLELVIYPNAILKQPCADIVEFNEDLDRYVQSMYFTMRYHKGIGLAAPQVGSAQRLCIIEFEERQLTLINPSITKASGSEVAIEGCLSLPGEQYEVERPKKITVEAQDITGKPVVYNETGFFARIIQHEMDHLSGQLINEIGAPYINDQCPE